ncbi:MAG: HNH endonuclease [Gemmatimonadaceae bacterium]
MMPLRTGYVGLTDPDWYAFLAAQSTLDEVNFWQPHGGRMFRAIARGEPFFFKLRAPARAIAGFGFFERFESLPAWLAWECFGAKNGASTFEEMVARIIRLRGDNAAPNGDFEIGCVMLTAPVFFRPNELIAPPSDWARTGIQQGKTYSLATGEGARLWRECHNRAFTSTPNWNVDRVAEDSPRYGEPVLVRPRLGQGTFSLAVRDAYGGACAVTHEHSTPVLEAAHIIPYAPGGVHEVENGLFLRRDLHRLFDLGYVTVTPTLEFKVGSRLRAEFSNGRTYYALSGSRIAVPTDPQLHPRREYLDWHSRTLFKA